MRQFEYYEFVSYVIPGTILLAGVASNWTTDSALLPAFDVSIGGLGLTVIIAYAGGHLVQAIGDSLERFFWSAFRGIPTDWMRSGKRTLLSDSQRIQLDNAVAKLLSIPGFQLSSIESKDEWFAITRQIYAVVEEADRNTRVDFFNGVYGLCRGMATSLALLLIIVPVMHTLSWKVFALITSSIIIAGYRMYKFGVHYARELFVQFLAHFVRISQKGKP